VARAAAGAKGEKEILKALVEVLSTLVLVNAAEMRTLCGTVYRTFLIPAKAKLAEDMLAAGKLYNDTAKEQKDKKAKLEKEGKKEEADKIDLAAAGPPHMQVWAAMCFSAAKQCQDPQSKTRLEEYWNTQVCGQSMQNLGRHVNLCRAKKVKPQKGTAGEEMVRIQFAINGLAKGASELEAAIEVVLLEQKAEEKQGPAPRGSLERDAQRLLDAYKKL